MTNAGCGIWYSMAPRSAGLGHRHSCGLPLGGLRTGGRPGGLRLGGLRLLRASALGASALEASVFVASVLSGLHLGGLRSSWWPHSYSTPACKTNDAQICMSLVDFSIDFKYV